MHQFQLHHQQPEQAAVLIVGCSEELSDQLARTVLDLRHRAFLWETPDSTPEFVLGESWHVCFCGPETTPEQAQTIWDIQSSFTRILWIQSDSSAHDPLCPGDVLPDDLSPYERITLLRSMIDRAVMTETLVEAETQLEKALFRDLVCHSPSMQQTRSGLQQAAKIDTPLVLLGETGVNNRKAAWAIHQASSRSKSPFFSLDCESYSSDAFEAELFQLDSQTDDSSRLSLLEQLDGGTLLLKNIQSLAQATQKKLIRFIESPAVPRHDSLSLRYISLRWSFAISLQDWEHSNSPVIKYLRERNDLSVISLPSLAERIEDLPELIRSSLAENSARLGILPPTLSNDAWQRLELCEWPGNEEQLHRVTTQILKLAHHELVTAEMIEPWLNTELDESETGEMTLAEMERQLIEATFARCGGNREKTAQSLGIGLRTLSGKLRQYGYPPRGGPGSNRKRPTIVDEASSRRAA